MKTRKTAGTSIEMLLEPLCAPPGHIVQEKTQTIISKYGVIGSRLIPKDGRLGGDHAKWGSHVPARRVKANLGAWKWHRYFKFTSVRNPFDRAVSGFYWGYQNNNRTLPTEFSERKALFKEFVVNGPMKLDFGAVHVNQKFCVQDVIRFENLRSDIVRICEKHRIPVDISAMPNAKSQTSRKKKELVADHYDAESTRAVRDKMAWVFDHFDYSHYPEDCDAVKQAGAML